MLEGLILGLITFISFVVSFMKLPAHIKEWLLTHKAATDLGAAALCFLLISGISKSIVALFASMFAGLLVGVSIEAADMASKDPEVREKLIAIRANLLSSTQAKLRNGILNFQLGTPHETSDPQQSTTSTKPKTARS